jgi:hypothetical protein
VRASAPSFARKEHWRFIAYRDQRVDAEHVALGGAGRCYVSPGGDFHGLLLDKSHFSASSEPSILLVVIDIWLKQKTVANCRTYCLLLSGFHLQRICTKASA